MSRLRSTLTTACLVGALSGGLASAGPRPRPLQPQVPATLSHVELSCQAYGGFAYNRAMDRNHGYGLVYLLGASRAYDRQSGADATIVATHDRLIRLVFKFPALTPAQVRQITESACLEDTDPLTPKTPENRLRY